MLGWRFWDGDFLKQLLSVESLRRGVFADLYGGRGQTGVEQHPSFPMSSGIATLGADEQTPAPGSRQTRQTETLQKISWVTCQHQSIWGWGKAGSGCSNPVSSLPHSHWCLPGWQVPSTSLKYFISFMSSSPHHGYLGGCYPGNRKVKWVGCFGVPLTLFGVLDEFLPKWQFWQMQHSTTDTASFFNRKETVRSTEGTDAGDTTDFSRKKIPSQAKG